MAGSSTQEDNPQLQYRRHLAIIALQSISAAKYVAWKDKCNNFVRIISLLLTKNGHCVTSAENAIDKTL